MKKFFILISLIACLAVSGNAGYINGVSGGYTNTQYLFIYMPDSQNPTCEWTITGPEFYYFVTGSSFYISFTQTGIYNITVRVIFSNGYVDYAHHSVNIYEDVSLSGQTSVRTGTTHTYTSSYIYGLQYYWKVTYTSKLGVVIVNAYATREPYLSVYFGNSGQYKIELTSVLTSSAPNVGNSSINVRAEGEPNTPDPEPCPDPYQPCDPQP